MMTKLKREEEDYYTLKKLKVLEEK